MTARRLRALEAEAGRLAQVAAARNRSTLLTVSSLMPPPLLAAVREYDRLWGEDAAGLTRCRDALMPPGVDLDLDPATCPAAAWIVDAGSAFAAGLLLPAPPPRAAAILDAQAARWAQLAQDHAGQPLGKLALYEQAHLTMCARLAETVQAGLPGGAK